MMTYIVSGSTTRKEFETIVEAIDYRGKSDNSIYITDAFGNVTLLDEVRIREILNKEKSTTKESTIKESVDKPTIEKNDNNNKVVDVNITVATEKKEDPLKNIIYYAIWTIIVIIAGIVIYYWVIPAISNLLNIFNKL